MRLIIIFFVFCSTIFAQKRDNSQLRSIIGNYSDSLNNPKYGIVTLVKHKGNLNTFAIGWANEKNQMTIDKIFNIGSLTKMFTAILVLQELEKGKLKLTDTIGKFFPRSKNADGRITIEMLLKHRSGLGEVGVDSLINQAATDMDCQLNCQNLYDRIPTKSFNKNEKFEYTNTNYILLGYILEKINDIPYEHLLQERIFNVCNMKDSYAYFSNTFNNSAHSMLNGQDISQQLNFRYFKNFCFSAGGISSTVTDLYRFFECVYETEKLISRKTFGMMLSFDENNYGLGIERTEIVNKMGKEYWFGHAGDNISYKIRNYYNPKTKDLIIVASNQMSDPFSTKIVNKIFESLDK